MRWVVPVGALLLAGVALAALTVQSCACAPKTTLLERTLEDVASAVGISYKAPRRMP